MAIRKFKNSDLSKYYFDTDLDQVMSLYSGSPQPLKWAKHNKQSLRRIALVTNYGFKVNYRYDQIINMLGPVEAEVDAAGDVSDVQGLDLIKPDFDYVLFSTQNRCSQYIFANTSIQEALDRLARRGEYVDFYDIRILNTQTNKVSKLAIKTVTAYTLV